MIKIKNLNKYFNKRKKNEIHVIDNTTLEFEDTGLVCILGESGSGKTTLLNTIGGLDDFSDGSITVDDVTLNRYNSKQIEKLRNRKYGYIFQNYYLLMDATVEYNIRIALDIFDITPEETKRRIDYVLEAVGMEKYKNRLVSDLSGGQQQRVTIARALAKAPDIIFADEPTGNLDENNTMRIMSIIKKISSECLVILVTHELRIAEFFADRIIEIKDGTVISDRLNKGNGTYVKSEDRNIYLGELEHCAAVCENSPFNLYTDGHENGIRLTLAVLGGKLYIKSNDEANTVFITGESEMDILPGKRPVVDIEDVEEFDYSLEPVKLKKTMGLPMGNIWKLATTNIKTMGKKQFFIFFALVVTAVLLTLSVTDYYAAHNINTTNFITDDSHYVSFTLEGSQGSVYASDFGSPQMVVDKIYQNFLDSDIDGKLTIRPSTMLIIKSDKYVQYNDLDYKTAGIAYVDSDELTESDLICGRMPDKYNEVVLDKMVVDKFKGNKSVIGAVIDNYEDAVGLMVSAGYKFGDCKVVGICDTGEVSVYMDKEILINKNCRFLIRTLESLKKEYPGEYDDYTLGENQAIISDYYYDGFITDDITNEIQYSYAMDVDVNKTFHGEFADIVIREEDIDKFIHVRSISEGNLQIYTDEPDKVKEFFLEQADEYKEYIEGSVKYTYGDEVEEYFDSKKQSTGTKSIVTILVLIMTLIVLFFMMKTNAINRTGELVVYRLIGISPSSIVKSYIMELTLIATMTQLPAVIIAALVMKYLSAVGILTVSMVCPIYFLVILIVFCYLTDIIVGTLPIWKIIKVPPAHLAAKN